MPKKTATKKAPPPIAESYLATVSGVGETETKSFTKKREAIDWAKKEAVARGAGAHGQVVTGDKGQLLSQGRVSPKGAWKIDVL